MKTQAKSWFEFRNALGGRAEIAIMDEIGAFGVTAAAFKSALDSVPPAQPILLHICSGGGDITEGNEIYNALAEHPGGVEVEGGALMASIASVIAMAGNPVTMPRNGFMMIHNPMAFTAGDSEDHRKSAEIMNKMKAGIVAAYQKKTKKPATQISSMMDEETWMTADEALENGFIDSIRDEEDSGFKNFDLTKFHNSANFRTRLQKQSEPAEGSVGSGGGNSSRSVTLSDLEDAAKPKAVASTPIQPTTLPEKAPKMELTDDQKKDQQAIIDKLASAKAVELLKAQNKLHQDIDEVVLKVRDRDKKDFSALAGRFKQDGKTLDEFYRAIATSDEFKAYDTREVVGSGIEVGGIQGLPIGSPGEVFIASEEYKSARDSYKNGGSRRQGKQLANTRGFIDALVSAGFRNVSTSSGLTSIEKLPGVVELAVRRLTVKDLISGGATNSTLIRYIQETSFTNAATTVAEGATKPAASFAYAEVDSTVKKIAAYTKVSDELWSDYLAIASYINMRLPYMVERTEEDQLINGDGTGANLLGLIPQAAQTQALGGDTRADAIFKAMTKVRFGISLAVGGYEPDGMIINPNDWQQLRLAKDANNQYFGGGPFTGAYGNSGMVQFDMFWGKPVVITPAITAGTALVGAFRLAAQYFMRQGLMIETTNTDQDDFIKNLTTIRAELREALCVYLPLALCTVTGL